MINPNKIYKQSSLYTIKSIDARLQLVTVSDDCNQIFTGYIDHLDNITRKNWFKVGDTVKIGCKFSIMSDRWVIRTMSKVRTK